MKNKVLILIILMSFCLIFLLGYLNYFNNTIKISYFNNNEKLEVYKKFNYNKINACYGNKIKCVKITYKTKGKVNEKKLGSYNITYEFKYRKKIIVKKQNIDVVDNKAPKLEIKGNFDNVCPNGKTDMVILKATDNYDGDITNKIKYKVKNNLITYKVKDSSGNITTKKYKVKINDEQKPTIILNGDSTIYLGVGNKYKEPGYMATDNCDGDITNNVKILGNININKAGSYELTYQIKDLNNNISNVKRVIRIFPKNNYNPENVGFKTIYLTFDDGPGPYTANLLNILNTYGVKATFFVTGYDNNYNDLITREYNEGHTVGLHTYSHNYASIYQSIDSYMEDLTLINDKVRNLTGNDSKIIRFPGGSSNTISRRFKIGIMSDLSKKVEELGFRYFDWTILSGDAGNTKNPSKIYENVINNLGENKINMILMHDIKSYTVEAIPRIIETCLANGYTFAPITINSPVVHQHINN